VSNERELRYSDDAKSSCYRIMLSSGQTDTIRIVGKSQLPAGVVCRTMIAPSYR